MDVCDCACNCVNISVYVYVGVGGSGLFYIFLVVFATEPVCINLKLESSGSKMFNVVVLEKLLYICI